MKRQAVLVVTLVVLILAIIYGGLFLARYFSDLFSSTPMPDAEEAADEEEGAELPLLTPPEDFAIEVYASGLEGPRVMTRDPQGVLVVSLTRAGRIAALPDHDGNGRADEEVIILDGLRRPHGVLFRCDALPIEDRACSLYVAEEHAVSAYQYDSQTMQAFNRRELAALPTEGGGHSTRTLLEDPDADRLLVSVGSSCNVCVESDPRRAAIIAVRFDGGPSDMYARGLRNAVFMTLHPVTGEVWATENGRDWLGDDVPPDEINIVRKGGNYGWPVCYGKNVHDTDFDKSMYVRAPCSEPFELPSHIDIQAHSAPLGLAFIPEEGWPEEYRRDLLVAYHGSWNRSEPTGYKVVRFELSESGELEGREDFVAGWLAEDGQVRGRPVDIMAEPGGMLYISDDRAGVVYRVVYTGS